MHSKRKMKHELRILNSINDGIYQNLVNMPSNLYLFVSSILNSNPKAARWLERFQLPDSCLEMVTKVKPQLSVLEITAKKPKADEYQKYMDKFSGTWCDSWGCPVQHLSPLSRFGHGPESTPCAQNFPQYRYRYAAQLSNLAETFKNFYSKDWQISHREFKAQQKVYVIFQQTPHIISQNFH
ncbi:hypothetical protein HGM15179_011114 [Zosterops borbonicus]|uniref:Uncharacterized protein n=1 Tax=Zosterops borbonicus TaxID=364589 RepID=A0A8K1GDF1_9PASS|nr:hypothetical protein HGM15179_011114 [Zosterops borbonicus]